MPASLPIPYELLYFSRPLFLKWYDDSWKTFSFSFADEYNNNEKEALPQDILRLLKASGHGDYGRGLHGLGKGPFIYYVSTFLRFLDPPPSLLPVLMNGSLVICSNLVNTMDMWILNSHKLESKIWIWKNVIKKANFW